MAKRWDQYTEDTTLDTTSIVAVETSPASTHYMRKITLLNWIKSMFKQNLWEKGASISNPPSGFMAIKFDSNGFPLTQDSSGGTREIIHDISFTIPVFAADATVVVGDGKAYVPSIPTWMNGMNVVNVVATVKDAGVTGTIDIQIRNVTDSVDMLSTKLTIDSGETSSHTAATAVVIDGTKDDLASYDMLAIDVDAVSSGTAQKGLWITFYCRYP